MALRLPRRPIRPIAPGLWLLGLIAVRLSAGWSFDTGSTPEEARDLLATDAQPCAPAGSWLRLRNLDISAILTGPGAESPPWPGVKPSSTVATRRQALEALRAKGYRLVALLRWPSDSWVGGVRKDNPLRRTPYDLREAFARCQALARTYGDLIDYWEIDNEPDISFVEENPETYTAFLKACYLGIRDGATGATGAAGERSGEQGAGKTRAEVSDQKSASLPPAPCSLLPRDNVSPRLPSPSSVVPRSNGAVLMAPLALPPGPYFTAFVANHGLQYTDGFNYHYYGYAEDFTGVYQQFHEAVSQEDQRAQSDPARLDAVLATNFYPSSANKVIRETAGFDPTAPAQASRALLLARPLAAEEPALVPQGRCLVSPGVTVEETAEGWIFHVTRLAPGPLRPAMAELPLPDGWKPGPDSLLSFEHRLATATAATSAVGAVGAGSREEGAGETGTADRDQESEARSQTSGVRDQKSASLLPSPCSLPQRGNAAPSPCPSAATPPPPGTRDLPVFLTEYGYGLLSKTARSTIAGRTRQDAWFGNVQSQIHTLGLEGAMAFLLRPYLEYDYDEFGLLMDAAAAAAPAAPAAAGAGSRVKGAGKTGTADGSQTSDHLLPRGNAAPSLRPSPALETLVQAGLRPITPQAWRVSAPVAPTAVVLDFAAGAGLVQAKAFCGYLATGEGPPPAEGRLIAYNFGRLATAGELRLEGAGWSFPDRSRTRALILQPGERRELAVRIAPTLATFSPEPVRAWFHASATGPVVPSPASPAPAAGTALPAAKPQSLALSIQASAPRQAQFDPYLRTANGNLYATLPSPIATEAWQNYTARLGNLTLTFFGRAQAPWRFAENRPVALVFFFRPKQLPATFEIRRARVFELQARPQ